MTTADKRMTGRKLQRRRLDVWKKDPHCAACGRVVAFPYGFELDHIIALEDGGADAEDNTQILCIHHELINGELKKFGCHIEKTNQEK